jgi:hypothetical protein
LCFRCPNEQCEPILDIYASRAFHWYKERNKTLRFDPSNRSLKFQESTGTPSPNLGVILGVWRFTPSHSPTLPGVSDVTPGLPLGPHPCNPFALVTSPKLGLRQRRAKQARHHLLHLKKKNKKMTTSQGGLLSSILCPFTNCINIHKKFQPASLV